METNGKIQRTERWVSVGRGVGRLHEKAEVIKKCRLVVTKSSKGCKVQHQECIQ